MARRQWPNEQDVLDQLSNNQSYNTTFQNTYHANPPVFQNGPGRNFICEEHHEQVTNFCLNCLRLLCPDCIDGHYKQHFLLSQTVEIDSIKNIKKSCVAKVDSAIQSLANEMKEVEIRFLLDPDQVIREGVAQINHTKEKTLLMVRKYFEMKEEQFCSRVKETLLRAGDFQPTFNKISNLIAQLEQLKNSLDDSSYLIGIQKICRLDLNTMKEKLKSQLHKVTQERDTEPIQVLINDQKLLDLQRDLEQIVILTKQSELPSQKVFNNTNQNFGNKIQGQNRLVTPNQQKFAQEQIEGNDILNGFGKELALQKSNIQLDMRDFFGSISEKILPFFTTNIQTGQSELIYANIDPSNQKNQNNIFTSVQIDIDFMIPSFHKSIILPDGEIYLIGGTNFDKTKSGSIYNYNRSTKKLEVENDQMKNPRSSFGITQTKNFIFVIGGLGNNSRLLDSCERFDLKYRKWETKASLNQACSSCSCTDFNQKLIFKFGGIGKDKKIVNVIEKYDILLNKWEVINFSQDSLPVFLSDSASTQVNSQEILVFGGNDEQQVGQRSSFVLRIEEKKESSLKEYACSIQKINPLSLQIAEGFSNPQVVVQNKLLYVLQDVSIDNESSSIVDSERNLLQFSGQNWTIITRQNQLNQQMN